MDRDNQALSDLNKYIAAGKSYHDARTLLKKKGYTELQINNATFAMRNNLSSVKENDEMAKSLLNVTNAKAKSDAAKNRSKGRLTYLGGNLPLTWLPEQISSWWYFLPFLLLICYFLYLFSKS